MMQHYFDHILDALSQRTQKVFDTAQGQERHPLLTRRVEQLRGSLELARLLGSQALSQRIESLINTVQRDIEAD